MSKHCSIVLFLQSPDKLIEKLAALTRFSLIDIVLFTCNLNEFFLRLIDNSNLRPKSLLIVHMVLLHIVNSDPKEREPHNFLHLATLCVP